MIVSSPLLALPVRAGARLALVRAVQERGHAACVDAPEAGLAAVVRAALVLDEATGKSGRLIF